MSLLAAGDLLDLSSRLVFFPVRHHSPAAARLVRALARRLRPEFVLIEGPSDFNDRLDELALPHRLPIAIYSYVRLPDGQRRGAYYPLCVYSPEWQAFGVARELGAAVRFIDLPWSGIAANETVSNRYADAELRRSAYVDSLCRQLGVEGFDALWDSLVEQHRDLSVEEYLTRMHHFCLHVRLLEAEVRPADCRREAYMAEQVRQALTQCQGRILVVTGGYHSSALCARVTGRPMVNLGDAPELLPVATEEEKGIALTPYSYERLDSLSGYEAGMPNPGFYHQVWQDRQQGQHLNHRRLLRQVAQRLREQKQPISSADLIAAQTTAEALARLRGREAVWRADLVDGITAALIKEELAYGMTHPLLQATHAVLRGNERGWLAEGTTLPPLVRDLRNLLAAHDLEPRTQARELELDLLTPPDRQRSQVLHRLSLLGISGFERLAGADLVKRDDLARVWEKWRIGWSPDFEATSIEAARYGPALLEAAAARLQERAAAIERDAEKAALLLLDASLAGLPALANDFQAKLAELIRGDSNFFTVTAALDHLLYLHHFDAALQTAGRADLGGLLREIFTRGLWLLEGLGQTSGHDRELLAGVRCLLESFERCGQDLELNRDEFVEVLRRVGQDRRQGPLTRGAAVGALWTLGEADAQQVKADLLFFSDAGRLGDFLAGLFCLAREVVQRHQDLILGIDQLLLAYADEEFLTALPALRLAFTFFTPREKHHMATTLLQALGLRGEQPLTPLEVSVAEAAQAFAFEARLFDALKKYGLRGASS